MKGLRRVVYGVGGIGMFFVAVQLLSAGAGLFSVGRQALITSTVHSPVSALGGGWLLSYLFLSGSPAAALFLALFDAGLVSVLQLFLALAGSRVGASAIVVIIGLVGYVSGASDSIAESVSMGVLTFIISILTYIPAVGLGLVIIEGGWSIAVPSSLLPIVPGGALAGSVATELGGVLSVVTAIVLMLVSFKVFDRAFAGITSEQFRSRRFRFLFGSPWVALALGAVMTLITTSVSVSLGIVVPLYYRGLVHREDVLPYILGANITTLMDTLLAAVVLGSPGATGMVLLLGMMTTLVTIVCMVGYDRFFGLVKLIFDGTMRSSRRMTALLTLLALLPLVLLLM